MGSSSLLRASGRPTRVAARRRVLGWLGKALIGLLVGFHAVLLAQRLSDLSLLEPGIALRWLGAAAFLVGWHRLSHRLGHRQRRTAFWMIVLLLHLPGLGATLPPASEAPTALNAVAFSLLLLGTLALALASRDAGRELQRRRLARQPRLVASRHDARGLPRLPRPPPGARRRAG